MLFSSKIQFLCGFFIFALSLTLTFVSTENEKVKGVSQKEFNTFVMKFNDKFDFLNDRVDEMVSKGNNPINAEHEIIVKIAGATNASKDEIVKKIEEILKGWVNSTASQLLTLLEQKLDSCTGRTSGMAERKTSTNLCLPNNPCLYGGRCLPSATGKDYVCVDCPKFTSGSRCENVECSVDKRCWRYRNTLYKVIESAFTWEVAKVRCEEKGMTLAMPKDQERTRFLRDQLKPIYNGYTYNWVWMGIKREARGWVWVDGSGLGEYTGGWMDMKSKTGVWFGELYLNGGSVMWNCSGAATYSFPICESHLPLTV